MVKIILTYLIVVLASNLYGQSFDVKVVENPLNGNVFSPAYWNNQIVVCSDQKDRIYKTVKDKNDSEPVDLFSIL